MIGQISGTCGRCGTQERIPSCQFVSVDGARRQLCSLCWGLFRKTLQVARCYRPNVTRPGAA